MKVGEERQYDMIQSDVVEYGRVLGRGTQW